MTQTYKEWKAQGRQVKKGEKAHGRNKQGEAVFTIFQTKRHYEHDGDDYDDPWDRDADDFFMGGYIEDIGSR